MKRIRQRFAIFAAALLAMLGMSIATASASSAASWGVDMNRACAQQWPGTVGAKLTSNNVMGWKCYTYYSYGIVYFPIDVGRYCRTNYSASATYTNYNNPYSWYCYR